MLEDTINLINSVDRVLYDIGLGTVFFVLFVINFLAIELFQPFL